MNATKTGETLKHTVQNVLCDSFTAGEFPVLLRLKKVAALVETLTASWIDHDTLLQRRKSHRIKKRIPFFVTPLVADRDEPAGQSQIVWAWDISLAGISFLHDALLPSKNVAATFVLDDSRRESVVTKLNWCRFTRERQYRSGGQFLRTIDSACISDTENFNTESFDAEIRKYAPV